MYIILMLVAVICGYGAAVQLDATDCKHSEFTSPNWPANYGNDEHLEWEITTDPGRHIVLQYAAFDIQGDVPGCFNDNLKIFDAGVQKRVDCGDSTQIEYTSISNNVKVVFHTNNAVTAPGFRMLWNPVCDECPLSGCDRTSPDPPCVSYHSCRWGYYLHDFSCPGGSTIQCQDDCYSCASQTYEDCEVAAGYNPAICVLERETPCGETAGLSIMIQRYDCEIFVGTSYKVTCSRPCCCTPISFGPRPGPVIHCRSPINEVDQPEADCPGFRNIF